MSTISFYITRSARTEEHYLIYLDCIDAIHKTYPGVPIIVIRDNETFDFAKYDINENISYYITKTKLYTNKEI